MLEHIHLIVYSPVQSCSACLASRTGRQNFRPDHVHGGACKPVSRLVAPRCDLSRRSWNSTTHARCGPFARDGNNCYRVVVVQVSPVRTPTEVGRLPSSGDFHFRLFRSGNLACSKRTPKACSHTASWRSATNPICPALDKAMCE